MNVTIKIDDRLYREARHRAVDSGQSLSAWVAELIDGATRDGVRGEGTDPTSLLGALGNEELADVPMDVPRPDNEMPEPARFS